MKTPIPEILVFSRWFPPAELPPHQNIFSDLVALALVVSSTRCLQAGRGIGREKLELLRLYSPDHFSYTNHWASVKAQDRLVFKDTTNDKPETLPSECDRGFKGKQPIRGLERLKRYLVEENFRRNIILIFNHLNLCSH